MHRPIGALFFVQGEVLRLPDDLEKLHELITNVRLDIRELNTKMDGIKDLTTKVAEVDKELGIIGDSVKSAHHRIEDMKQTQKWLIGVAVTSAGVAIAAIGLVLKLKGV